MEFEIRLRAEEVPTDDAAGVDEVNFDIRRTGDFIEIKTGFRKAGERVERTALQQFREGALQCDLEARVGAEAGEATLILRMQQGHVHDRVTAAERSILNQYSETGGAQRADAGGNAWITIDDFLRHIGQAKAFTDDTEFDMSFKNFR